MKSAVKYCIIAVIACCAGYLLGANYGYPPTDGSQTSGDINRTNAYKTIISDPEEQMPIIEQRLSEFGTVTRWACIEAEALTGDDVKDIKKAASALAKLQKKCNKVADKPDKAFELLGEQIKVGKDFVNAVDTYLFGKAETNKSLASIRDVVASFCTQNALLTQNDDEIDYWSDAPALLQNEDMVYTEPDVE